MRFLHILGIGVPSIIILLIIIVGILEPGVSVEESSPESLNGEEAFIILTEQYSKGDYISLGYILNNEIRNLFTIGVWIKLDKGALQKELNYVTWKSDDSPGMRVHSNGYIVFSQKHGGDGCCLVSNKTIKEEEWYYLSYVFDGYEFRGYINGEGVGSAPNSGYSPGGEVLIGADEKGYSSQRYFEGTIDELKIWNRALNENEILEEYNSVNVQNNNQSTGLIAYYKFEGNAQDSSGYNNHGAVYGANLTTGISGQAYRLNKGPEDKKEVRSIRTTTIKNDFILTKRVPINYILCARYDKGTYGESFDYFIINYDIYVDGKYLSGNDNSYILYSNPSYIDVKPGETKVMEIKPKIYSSDNRYSSINELVLFKTDAKFYRRVDCQELIEKTYNKGTSIKIV